MRAFRGSLITALVLALGLAACGGDDKKGTTSGTGGMMGMTGGTAAAGTGAAGTNAGTGAAGTTPVGGTGAGGTTAGTMSVGGMAAAPMCDTAAASATMCGTNACPAPNATAMGACIVNCCTTDMLCGTQTAIMGMAATTCTAPPPADERCPDYMEDQGGLLRQGCCTVNNECGISSTILLDCVTSSPLVTTLPVTPIPCDGAGADSGVPADAGADAGDAGPTQP